MIQVENKNSSGSSFYIDLNELNGFKIFQYSTLNIHNFRSKGCCIWEVCRHRWYDRYIARNRITDVGSRPPYTLYAYWPSSQLQELPSRKVSLITTHNTWYQYFVFHLSFMNFVNILKISTTGKVYVMLDTKSH